MPEILAAALATPGLGWLALTIAIAGVVRGFTGFGTALIFVPVAGQFLPAAEIVLLITVTGVFSTAALVPGAWVRADKPEVGLMAAAAVITIPLGIYLLTRLDGMTIRWLVAAVAIATLAALVTGWRYHGKIRRSGLASIGGAAGVLGGMTGLTGPVVILFYLAGQARAEVVRANTILFLAALDIAIATTLILRGITETRTLVLGAVLAVPYLCTTLLGQAMFHPRHELLYRRAAYAVIALAVISGLPLFDQGG